MERVPQMQLPHAPVKAPCFRVRFPFQGKENSPRISRKLFPAFVVHICVYSRPAFSISQLADHQ